MIVREHGLFWTILVYLFDTLYIAVVRTCIM